MLWCYGAATRDVAVLQLAMLQRCGAATRDAGALWRYSSRQWRTVVHYAKMASDARARDNGSEQRWQAAAAEIFIYFFFFYSIVSKRTRARQREERQGFETCFLALNGWQAPSCQRQLPSTVATTLAPSNSNNTSSTSNTSSSNDNLKTHRQKKFSAFNMKQQKV